MRLTVAELMRTLDYIPKETAPDLHDKFLGELVAKRFIKALTQGSFLKKADRAEAERVFVASLSEEEINAWKKYMDAYRTDTKEND